MQSSQIHLSSLSDKNIYITKADLEYLHDAKVNGSFDAAKSKKRYEMAVEQELIPEIKNSNHNAERHAENREKLSNQQYIFCQSILMNAVAKRKK